jgi:hypothetical protein
MDDGRMKGRGRRMQKIAHQSEYKSLHKRMVCVRVFAMKFPMDQEKRDEENKRWKADGKERERMYDRMDQNTRNKQEGKKKKKK